jgi:hypothetical protein
VLGYGYGEVRSVAWSERAPARDQTTLAEGERVACRISGREHGPEPEQ